MSGIPVPPRPGNPRGNNRAATDKNPAMITPDAVRAIQSLWPATEAGGAPATKPDLIPILEARGLMKRYGKTQALAGLDLVVNPGRVVALLGPNGAGKTTLVRAVATLLRPD